MKTFTSTTTTCGTGGVRDLFESPLLDSVLDHVGTSANCSTIRDICSTAVGFSLHRSPHNHCHTHKCTFVMIPLVSPLDSSLVCDMLCACVQLVPSAHAGVIVGAVIEIIVDCHRHHADDSARPWRRASKKRMSPSRTPLSGHDAQNGCRLETAWTPAGRRWVTIGHENTSTSITNVCFQLEVAR